jgi:hypothetical protein
MDCVNKAIPPKQCILDAQESHPKYVIPLGLSVSLDGFEQVV